MATRRSSSSQQEEFAPTLPDGTTLSDGVSILIKEMRRGKELESLYWARQIEAGGYWKYLFRRFAIFACEDVGTGNALALGVVNSCREAYEVIRQESSSRKSPDGNVITHVVRVLCRSEKNRENDHLKNAEHVLRSLGWKPETPEYAIDMHTKEGRELYENRKERDALWFTEWSHCEHEKGPFDWRLWHLRRMVKEGTMADDAVEALAQRWNEEGLLAYGLEGPVEVVAARER